MFFWYGYGCVFACLYKCVFGLGIHLFLYLSETCFGIVGEIVYVGVASCFVVVYKCVVVLGINVFVLLVIC